MDTEQSYLDGIRIAQGSERCAEAFREAFEKNGFSATALINDRRFSFPCLFVLAPQIKELRLYPRLNSRNLTALKIMGQFLERWKTGSEDYLSVKRNRVYTVLKWMLETGYQEDGMNEDYEQIMESAAAVLLNIYKDDSILPIIIDMIFKRGIKGHYIHDLVWSVFKLEDPRVLKLIAQRLRSPEDREAELARYLLNLDIDFDMTVSKTMGMREEPFETGIIAVTAGEMHTDVNDKERQYDSYIKWLEENDPFLYFTEDSFQYASKPVFSAIDYERKYLHKKNGTYVKQPILPSDSTENAALSAFRPLSEREKSLLSEYSFRKYARDPAQWEQWIRTPIAEQLMDARNDPGDTI
ncbi:MAG: hypothetical protein GX111_09320 [Clostridiales bacterium]|nr:hypothetical protein [Clostridiales bacterium]